jgi:hypothetical protein
MLLLNLAQRVVGSLQPRLLSLYIPFKETEALEAELKTILAKIWALST